MGLQDRIAEIRSAEAWLQKQERIAKEKQDMELHAKNKEREAALRVEGEENMKKILPLLDVACARGFIEEARGIWGVGEIYESHHPHFTLMRTSASVSLKHSFLELEPLYRGTLDEGTDPGPQIGTRIFQSEVVLAISAHGSQGQRMTAYGGYTSGPYASIDYNKYKITEGLVFPQRTFLPKPTTEHPWGRPTGGSATNRRPLVYNIPFVDIRVEDPERTKHDLEYQLAKVLSQTGSPKFYGLRPEDIDKDPFLPGNLKNQIFPRQQSSLPWYRRILG